MSNSWGVDIGGTTTVVGHLKGLGFTTVGILPTNPHESPERLLERIMDVIGSTGGTADTIGIGIAGFVDRSAGVLRESPNLPLMNGFPLRASLSRLSGCPVVMENDCNAFTIGALNTGDIPEEGVYLLVTLGTGIGGTIVTDGDIVYGEDFAGEFGHMTVRSDGLQCPCGNRGCWERYAAADSLVRYYESSGGSGVTEPRLLADMARSGDGTAMEAFRIFGEWIGIGLSNLAWCFNPSGILLGGGLAGSFDLFRLSAEEEYSGRCRSKWRVRTLKSCSEAGAHGAALAGAGSLS